VTESPRHVRPAEDATAAAWIAESMHGFALDVGSIVPPQFEAYARVFHPAHLHQQDVRGAPVRWAEIAAANGRTVHPEMQFMKIALIPSPYAHAWTQPGLADRVPEVGSLSMDEAAELAAVLQPHTTTPEDCFFAVWDGWGGLRHDMRGAPVVAIPGRTMRLLRGPIHAVTENTDEHETRFQSANLWWPADRAWCVATEIDLMSSYVGGSRPCIDAVLGDRALEALPVEVGSRITYFSDAVNPEVNPLFSRRFRFAPPPWRVYAALTDEIPSWWSAGSDEHALTVGRSQPEALAVVYSSPFSARINDVVEVIVAPDGAGSEVRLTQYGAPVASDDEAARFRHRWGEHLGRDLRQWLDEATPVS
jgi:hypothetical protein